MHPAIEIIRLGKDDNLFQVCDGLLFGLVEFEGSRPSHREQHLRHPHVVSFLAAWLEKNGILIGGQHPPRVEWIAIEMAVVAARAPVA